MTLTILSMQRSNSVPNLWLVVLRRWREKKKLEYGNAIVDTKYLPPANIQNKLNAIMYIAALHFGNMKSPSLPIWFVK